MTHSHPHHQPDTGTGGDSYHDARYKAARKVTLIGSAVDLLLGVAKIVAGYIGSSQALIADGIHSLSDLATDGVVLFAMKHGSREADEKHPYGHARIETLATITLGVALIGIAIGIAWDALLRLRHPELLMHPGWLALVVASISIVSKEAIYQYTLRVAKKWNSSLLRANAWHSRSDAISSVIVVIGILGSMSGLHYLDAVAAIGVALMVAWIGGKLAWHSAQELIDTAMEPEKVAQIRHSIQSVNGVQALHMLRTRRMGDSGLVDVHILVNPRISVSEGHRISETVHAQIMRDVTTVTDVMVHIDPEDDEQAAPSSGLPLRNEILARLQQRWASIEAARYIEEEDTVLHYLDGKIHVEVLLPLSRMTDINAAQAAAHTLRQQATAQPGMDHIADVVVRFH
ncbi:MAG: cation diffusion facilitator family transporter [Gammaproteobacteria bacterium]|nr:cation diffusion facilitator family transporter [Gammaproteobacteria bacterium]